MNFNFFKKLWCLIVGHKRLFAIDSETGDAHGKFFVSYITYCGRCKKQFKGPLTNRQLVLRFILRSIFVLAVGYIIGAGIASVLVMLLNSIMYPT